MHNKSRSSNDVQLIISSISVALTLGFWGLFASHEKSGTGVTGEAALPAQPDPAMSSSSPVLLPGQKLLFGGTNLQLLSQQQSTVQAQPTPIIIVRKKHGGNGSVGGGGGGVSAGTGSSHP